MTTQAIETTPVYAEIRAAARARHQAWQAQQEVEQRVGRRLWDVAQAEMTRPSNDPATMRLI